MGNKMLIDAAHPEETRVVVLRGNRIEEFDFESASKRQLRGNIYLAKVTRVEPSLQAAFIEYGGNRHGFLAFSEIHPDYYQIPVADRQALLEEEARSHAEEDEEQPRPARGGSGEGRNGEGRHSESRGGEGRGGEGRGGGEGRNGRRSRRHRRGDAPPAAPRRARQADEFLVGDIVPEPREALAALDETGDAPAMREPETDGAADPSASHEPVVAASALDEPVEAAVAAMDAHDDMSSPLDDVEPPFAFTEGDPESEIESDDGADHVTTIEGGREASHEATDESAPDDEGAADADHLDAEVSDTDPADAGPEHHDEDIVEQLGGDALEDVPHRVSRPRRNYKIQEVIKRRQVLLVQVVKEERGNKGAALTTYLSLAGRYSVLMPNTARGGGISRKITDAEDRKRLKAIAQELDVPDGMGIILRTAGAARGMPEVKRDFEYLMRMWETVRETTLRSSAPTLVYEEGSLIKRSIRDLFNKDVDEVMVSGEEAYREAKDFMRLLMPTHAKVVVRYSDPQPIFAKAGAEAQLDAMFSNQVTLRSGGYLVINQTEALVAIDVNSGRSTREHNIEDTALRTNLEAADEVARQLRLRDLAGLIVVDFIDMDEGRNDRAVERRIKDALKDDRARIQIGRISHFGLLEMSRQRMRTGVLEGSTVMCPHCAGSGTVRSMSSIALHVLRLIEDALIKSAAYNLIVRTRSEVALYILNQKRMNLLDLESRFGVSVTILADAHMTGAVYHALERGSEATPPVIFGAFGARPDALPEPEDEVVDAIDAEDEFADGELDLADVKAVAGPTDQPAETHARAAPTGEDAEGGRRRRRRRRRRGRDGQPGVAGHDEQSAEAIDAGGEAGDSGEDDELDQQALSDIAAGFAPPEAEAIATASVTTGEPLPSAEPATPAFTLQDPAFVAEAAPGDLPPPVEAGDVGVEAEAVEAPRRRRTRRTTRTAEGEAPVEGTEPVEAAAPARRARRPRPRVGETAPGLDLAPPPVAEAETAAPASPLEAAPELPLVPAAPTNEEKLPVAAAASPAPEPPPVVTVAEPEPERPKRAGWWQRVKAATIPGS